MQELIKQLTEKAGISEDQANKALHTIKDFIIEKFPMMAGAVENLLPTEGKKDDEKGGGGFSIPGL